ncbi:MAG: DUF554 domain-containing protein [Bacteroidaceae bacterium]|nr:DUF554 domain-containing protein [Bacteroidaceae bacterium]
MIGTIVNTAAIVIGSLVGGTLRKGIKEEYTGVLYNSLGLCTIVLGCNAAITHLKDSQWPVLFILSLAMGGIVGTALKLDERAKALASRAGGEGLAQGLTTAVLLFCIGTLSIVGPMNSALHGDHTFLYTNATLDLVSSAVLAATYGYGIALAAVVLFLWQGGIYALTLTASGLLSTEIITEVTIVGGVLILSTGVTLLDLKNCKTLNLIPALFVPPLFFLLKHLWQSVF